MANSNWGSGNLPAQPPRPLGQPVLTQTVLVRYGFDGVRTTSHARSALRQIGEVFSLEAPEDWPTEVWTAFERARSARITANVASNTARQDGGHALQHPGERSAR